MDYILANQFVTAIICITVLCFLLYIVSNNDMLTKLRTEIYTATIITVITVIICEIFTLCLEGMPGSFIYLNMFFNIMGFTLSALVLILLSLVLSKFKSDEK